MVRQPYTLPEMSEQGKVSLEISNNFAGCISSMENFVLN